MYCNLFNLLFNWFLYVCIDFSLYLSSISLFCFVIYDYVAVATKKKAVACLNGHNKKLPIFDKLVFFDIEEFY